MGMYTEIFFRAGLKEETPAQVLDVLEFLCDQTNKLVAPPNLPDHVFFQTYNWALAGGRLGTYFPGKFKSFFEKDPYLERFLIGIHANFTNYDDEIEKFVDWIDPYVDAHPGDFLGYSVYDSRDRPRLFFKRT